MEYKLSKDWGDIKNIVGFGAGRLAKKNLTFIMKHLGVEKIIDNDCSKRGMELFGVPICSFDDIKDELYGKKIVIMTLPHMADEIGKELEQYGLKKYKDFCQIEHFLSEWFWRFKNKVVLMELHTSILTSCTLNCKNCNMFMPYYKKHIKYTFEEIKGDLDMLFAHVDYVSAYRFLGGEPLLHPDLPDMIQYVADVYGEKVGSIGIITNGTILPDNALLDISKKHSVFYAISDYTDVVPYKKKLGEVLACLDGCNIEYSLSSVMEWRDFGFPENPLKFEQSNIKNHMLTCSPVFHGLNDGKLFYCHVAWSADKCERFKLKQSDYVDLKALMPNERVKILEHCMGEIRSDYVSLCAVCGGCGIDNKNVITAAIQADRGD